MGRRWKSFQAAVTRLFGGVPTNYGEGQLTSGTAITYRRHSDGKVYIDTPLYLYGDEIVRQPDGRWSLVGQRQAF